MIPEAKRKRTEHDNETEGLKRCNCKRSKCLKRYCQCFAAELHCWKNCSCKNCMNKIPYKNSVLDSRKQIERRNRVSPVRKRKRTKHDNETEGTVLDKGKQIERRNRMNPESKRSLFGNCDATRKRTEHDNETEGLKRCNCKRSKCLKRYCPCSAAEQFCWENCSCKNCMNKIASRKKTKHDNETEGTVLDTRKQSERRNRMSPERKRKRTKHGKETEGTVIDKGKQIERRNRLSPERKRMKTIHDNKTEGCERCNCKGSNCLKLYCQCFAAGFYCGENCSSKNCMNKIEYEDTVLQKRKQIESRNPRAFAPKVVKHAISSPSNSEEEANQTAPSSSRHKRGCNCKKSKCAKKYCECYKADVGCFEGCQCEGCDNPFGRKADRRIEN